MHNLPRVLREGSNLPPELGHNRMQIDEALRGRAFFYIQSSPDFERVQAGEMAPSVFIEQVVASSPKEISNAVRVMCAVILGAFVMQGCGSANIEISGPSKINFAPSSDVDNPDASVDDRDAGADSQAEIPKNSTKTDLTKESFEWLPDYPVSKKIGVIINGDSGEDRHKKNVEAAINVLQMRGFDEIFVAQDAFVKDKASIHQYSGTKSSLDKLFADLKKVLIKDSIVFVYGTGHGQPYEGGAISLDEPIGVEEIMDYMKVIKEGESRIIGVFDSCYSGAFPQAIIEEEKLEGVVLSPGLPNTETCCNFFTPYFFEGLEKGADLNKDGGTEINEAFVSAMQVYRHQTGSEEYGEYMRSKTELTSENFDDVIHSQKTVIIDINATWCLPCKIFSVELAKLSGLVGEQVEVFTITDNINPEAKALYKKLAIDPKAFPTMVIKKPGINNSPEVYVGVKTHHELTELLQNEYDIAINNQQFVNRLLPGVIKKYPKHNEEIALFLQSLNSEQTWILRYLNGTFFAQFKKIKSGSYDSTKNMVDDLYEKAIRAMAPAIILKFSNKFKDQSYYAEVVEKAARHEAHWFPTSALEYSDRFKDQSYAESVILEAAAKKPWNIIVYSDKFKDQPYAESIIRAAAEKYPDYALTYSDKFKDQSYYADVLEEAVYAIVKEKPLNVIAYSDKFKDQPYYAELLEKAVLIAVEENPGDTFKYSDKFKDQPYYAEVLERAVRAIVEIFPIGLLCYSDKFKDQPYYAEVLEKAARASINFSGKAEGVSSFIISSGLFGPVGVIKYSDKFKDQPYYNEVLEDAVREVAENYPTEIFRYVDIFKDKPYYEEILEKSVRKASKISAHEIFYFIDIFKDKPYAKEMLFETVKRIYQHSTVIRIKDYEGLKSLSYYEDLVKLEKKLRKDHRERKNQGNN